MRQVPLRVCKAITIYKSQGGTVGPGHASEKLVVMLPPASSKAGRTPGVAQVGLSHTSELENLAIMSDPTNPLTMEQIQRIGVGQAYDKRRLFEQELRDGQESAAKQILMDWIIAEDPLDEKTFPNKFYALHTCGRGATFCRNRVCRVDRSTGETFRHWHNSSLDTLYPHFFLFFSPSHDGSSNV